jgi:glycine reductase
MGGEEKASIAPRLLEGPKGPGNLLQKLFPDIEVVATIAFGDNYVAENTDRAVQEILDMLTPFFEPSKTEKPVMLIAGPAFNAGRYGLACGAICKAVAAAVNEYRKDVYIAKAGEDVMSMEQSVRRLGALGMKLLKGEAKLPETDDYIHRGLRKNYFHSQTGATRAIDMLLKKLKGEPFDTEYHMPTFDRVEPAPAIKDLGKAKLALVTSGGIVPKGNPDRIAAANAQRYGCYPIEGISAFTPQSHQTAHGGYDPTFANANPNRILPLDAVRELEAEGVIGTIHDYYYATVGNATSVASARKFGESIAGKLLADGVQAVILTST